MPKKKLSPWQYVLTMEYGDGEFAHIRIEKQAEKAGDTLFLFLMRELSETEDCDSFDEAVRRVMMAEDQLKKLRKKLEEYDSIG